MTKDERIQELEDQVMVLKEALGLTYKGDPAWKLGPQQAQILGVIAKTTMASNDRIHTAVYGMVDRDPKIVAVQICKMRPKLAKHGITIKTEHGYGYYLTPESRAVVQSAG